MEFEKCLLELYQKIVENLKKRYYFSKHDTIILQQDIDIWYDI